MQLPTGNCTSCSEPLVTFIPSDSPTSSSAPGTPVVDDVTLPCGHHYHYACLEEVYLLTPPLSHCPSCQQPIHTHSRLVVTLHTEGGVVHNHDLTEAFEEEAFFDANPELKLQRAFLGFCAEGDVEAVKGMLEAEGGVVGNARDEEGGAVHVAVLAQGQWQGAGQIATRGDVATRSRARLSSLGRRVRRCAKALGDGAPSTSPSNIHAIANKPTPTRRFAAILRRYSNPVLLRAGINDPFCRISPCAISLDQLYFLHIESAIMSLEAEVVTDCR